MPVELQIGLALISTTTVVGGFDRMEQFPAATDSSVGVHVSRKDWKP